MSNTAQYAFMPIEVTKVEDPFVRLQNARDFVVVEGAKNIRYDQAITQNISNQSATVNFRLPNESTVFDRHFYVRATWRIQATADAAGGLIYQNELSAPAAFPTTRVTDQLTVQIDGSAFNSQPDKYWPALQRYFAGQANNCDIGLDYSTCPSMPDQYLDYNDFVTYGSARNPLAAYGEVSSMPSRGGFPLVVNNNTTTAMDVQFTSVEPLFISPALFGRSSNKGSGAMGATNLQFTWTFAGTDRVWSQNETVKPLTSITISLIAIDVLLRYGELKISEQISGNFDKMAWDYENIFVYEQSQPPLNAGASVQRTSGSIQLNNIPSRLYIYVQRSQGEITRGTPDSFFNITNVSIQWNSRSGILATATPQDLYLMSVKNGLQMSWAQWSQYCGSVLCIDVARDLGLDSLQAPGVNQDNQLRVQITYENILSVNVAPVLYVTAITPGIFQYISGNFYQQLGVLSSQNVLNAKVDNSGLTALYHEDTHFGSGFLSKLGNFIKNQYKSGNVRRAVGAIGDVASAALPEFAGPIRRGTDIATDIIKATGGKLRGSSFSGGMAMSRADKMRMMRDM
jgi:hypothetical protein